MFEDNNRAYNAKRASHVSLIVGTDCELLATSNLSRGSHSLCRFAPLGIISDARDRQCSSVPCSWGQLFVRSSCFLDRGEGGSTLKEAHYSFCDFETTITMMEPSENTDGKGRPCILWSSVARNDVILAEANMNYPWDETLQEAARTLQQKKPTPGWEFVTLHQRRNFRSPVDHPPQPRLKGMKFHIYENNMDGFLIWSVSAVYDPAAVDGPQVESFIQKIVTISEMFRETDPAWKYGSAMAAQKSFAPILMQRMEEVSYLGKMAMVNDQVESLKHIMAKNIELILERGERIEKLQEDSNRLQHMAAVFKKNSKQLKRQMLWQNAKHGMLIGTAITAGVAVVVVPPIVAAL